MGKGRKEKTGSKERIEEGDVESPRGDIGQEQKEKEGEREQHEKREGRAAFGQLAESAGGREETGVRNQEVREKQHLLLCRRKETERRH
ncbi:hypothetical protein EV2_028573 [Malus domestica]